jgi:hypothetical protein
MLKVLKSKRPAMSISFSLARLDLTQILCDVDDFYHDFERNCERDIH